MPGNLERRARRQKQSRLVLDPIGSFGTPRSPAKIRYTRSNAKASTEDSEAKGTGSNEVVDANIDEALPTPQKSSQAKDMAAAESEDHDSDIEITYSRRIQLATPSKMPMNAVDSSASSADEDEEEITPRRKSTRRSMTPSKQSKDAAIPTPKQTQPSSQKQPPSSAVSRRSRRAVIDEDSEDDNLPTLSQITKKTTNIEESSDDSDDLIVLSTPLRKGKQKAPHNDSGDDSDSSTLKSPTKKLKTRHRKSSTPEKSQGRLTRKQQQEKKKPPKRTPKQKAMELMRRRRAGEKITELTDSGSDEEQGPAYYDSGSSLEALSTFEDESESDDALKKKKTRKEKKNGNDDEEDDFIVEDDEEDVGVPGMGLHDIPIQFTNAAHKRKIEHFKDAVEWMVQRKINPAFDREDPIYTTAFQKLDDELRGYAMSTFASSAWREGFTRALFARPVFLEEHIGVDLIHDKCEACNRSGHPATFKISFGGKAYHKDSLEDVDNDPDSDDDESEHQDYDENGSKIPPEDEEFYVGSVCKGNAETAHSLTHWKYGLNDWVVDQLKTEKHLTPAKLAEREELSASKRSKIAIAIVDAWEAKGTIKELYNLLKEQLENARQGQQRGRR